MDVNLCDLTLSAFNAASSFTKFVEMLFLAKKNKSISVVFYCDLFAVIFKICSVSLLFL